MAEYCVNCGLVCYVGSRYGPDLNFKREDGKYQHYDCKPALEEEKKANEKEKAIAPFGRCYECNNPLVGGGKEYGMCQSCKDFENGVW